MDGSTSLLWSGWVSSPQALLTEFIDSMPLDHRTHSSTQLLREECLSKFCDDNDKSGADARRKAALDAWLAADRTCWYTNQRLSSLQVQQCPGVHEVIEYARKLLATCLPSASDIANNLGVGPGATATHKRKDASLPRKMAVVDVSEHFVAKFSAWTAALFPTWRPEIRVVPGQVWTSVPKKSSIDRSIGKEPNGNMLFQKALGKYFRKFARRFKVSVDRYLDLNTQEWNRLLCRAASLTGNYATVDLSMASDLIALALCDLLLPAATAKLIRMLRSPYATLPDGTVHVVQKCATMGNGFCWELESLLFAAIVQAVIHVHGTTHTEWAVFGDDMIIASEAVPLLSAVLSYCGLALNMKKTHASNSPGYRESCGSHYFKGVDIHPFYIRKPIRGSYVYVVHNRMVEWCMTQFGGIPASMLGFFNQLRSSAPPLPVPIGMPDDSGFWASMPKTAKYSRKRGGIVYDAWAEPEVVRAYPTKLGTQPTPTVLSDKDAGLYAWFFAREYMANPYDVCEYLSNPLEEYHEWRTSNAHPNVGCVPYKDVKPITYDTWVGNPRIVRHSCETWPEIPVLL